MRCIPCAASVLTLLSIALPVTAQTPARDVAPPDSVLPDSALDQLGAQLQAQSRIRVRLRTDQPDLVLLGPRLDGNTVRFERYAPGAWTSDTTTGPHAIPLAAIKRLQVRSSAWDTGAIIGFLVGAAAIEAVNAAGKYQIDRGETVFVGLLFGTAGAVAGGVIAAPFHKWHTIRESP
jgi:hypothetical protein